MARCKKIKRDTEFEIASSFRRNLGDLPSVILYLAQSSPITALPTDAADHETLQVAGSVRTGTLIAPRFYGSNGRLPNSRVTSAKSQSPAIRGFMRSLRLASQVCLCTPFILVLRQSPLIWHTTIIRSYCKLTPSFYVYLPVAAEQPPESKVWHCSSQRWWLHQQLRVLHHLRHNNTKSPVLRLAQT